MINVQNNADHKLIYDLLKEKEIDSIVTYDELESVCLKKDMMRHSVSKAIHNLLKDGHVWLNVRNIGYKKANSSEIVDNAPSLFKQAQRRLKKQKLQLETANDEDLTIGETVLKNTYLAANGVLTYLMKPKQVKQLQQKSMNNTLSFDPVESLKYLTRS